jgi:hypothetical protein
MGSVGGKDCSPKAAELGIEGGRLSSEGFGWSLRLERCSIEKWQGEVFESKAKLKLGSRVAEDSVLERLFKAFGRMMQPQSYFAKAKEHQFKEFEQYLLSRAKSTAFVEQSTEE